LYIILIIIIIIIINIIVVVSNKNDLQWSLLVDKIYSETRELH